MGNISVLCGTVTLQPVSLCIRYFKYCLKSCALNYEFSAERVNLNLITNGSAFEMNVAWQLQLRTLHRASIMYAASLRNSFTHLTQGPLCCCHEIKLYVGNVSFLYTLQIGRLAPHPSSHLMRAHKQTHTKSFILNLFLKISPIGYTSIKYNRYNLFSSL